MKTIVFVISILLVQGMISKAQVFEWSGPVSISDSISDNRNALLKEVRFEGTYKYMLFWERSENQNTTHIYCRNFYEQSDPFAVISLGNHHYTNVQILPTNFNEIDSLFFLFYETDINGDQDILYKIYTPGGFIGPFVFAATSENDCHLRSNDIGFIVWQEGNKIMACQLTQWNSPDLFSDPVTIDSISCSNPEITSSDYYPIRIAWQKQIDGNSYLYYSNYSNNSWSAPVYVFGTQNAENQRFSLDLDYVSSELIWECDGENGRTIKGGGFSGQEIFESNFSQQTPFYPSLAFYSLPVNDHFPEGFLTFVFDENQNNEIYSNDGGDISPEITSYRNISNSPFQETNPKFFAGNFDGYYGDLVNIWESKRNNHWQLFYSINVLLFGGNTPEASPQGSTLLKIKPNPFQDEIDISYFIKERANVKIELINIEGKQLILYDNTQDRGNHSFHVNFNDMNLTNRVNGCYLVRVTSGNQIDIQKIIRKR